MCVSLSKRGSAAPQFPPNVRVAKGRDWARRLAPALTLACMAVVFLAQVALADSMTLSPTHGQPTDSVLATYIYLPPPTSGCPVLKLAINFWWDSTSLPIGSALVNLDANKNCVAVIKFVPTTVKGALTNVGNHIVIAGPNGTVITRAPYTIDSPPPPPTTPPPTTPPPTHRPTPPPTHAPSPIPTPIPTPSPRCTTEGPAHGCVPVDCTRLTAAFLPFGGDGGVPPWMLLVLIVPAGALVFRHRRLAALSALALLLLVSTGCARLASTTTPSPTPAASVHQVVGIEATPSCRGYWMASNNGGIFPFGDAAGYGSTGAIQLNQPIVGAESTPDGHGYWLVAADGSVFPFGNAAGFGATGAIKLKQPIVAMEDTPDGAGYWLVASDGEILPFGDAAGFGSTSAIHLSQPIVDMEATPDGLGYWLVARDGAIFPFGDAADWGWPDSTRLNSPIVGMESTPDGHGYWLVASDGGIFPFGNAADYGSTGSVHLNSPITGMESTPDGHGYWLVTADGGIFPFGDAAGYGSLGGVKV